jgi:hypothetical protein
MFKKVRDEKLQSIQDCNVSEALSKIAAIGQNRRVEESIIDEDELIQALISLKK